MEEFPPKEEIDQVLGELTEKVLVLANEALNITITGAKAFYLAWLVTYTAKHIEPPPVAESRELTEVFLFGVFDQMERMAEHIPELRNFWVDEDTMDEIGTHFRSICNETYLSLVRNMNASNN